MSVLNDDTTDNPTPKLGHEGLLLYESNDCPIVDDNRCSRYHGLCFLDHRSSYQMDCFEQKLKCQLERNKGEKKQRLNKFGKAIWYPRFSSHFSLKIDLSIKISHFQYDWPLCQVKVQAKELINVNRRVTMNESL